MAELKWSNVDGNNLNYATNTLVNTNNLMYDRVKDLNQVAQSHLNNMQKGIDEQYTFDKEQNTQQILNQMANVDTLEGIKKNQEIANSDSLLSKFGSRVDLSKINSAKASWASDALNRNTAKEALKDTTAHAQSVKAQIEFLSNSGEHQKAMELLERNAGLFSNKMSQELTSAVRKGYEYDAELALKAKLTDAQSRQAESTANSQNALTQQYQIQNKQLNVDHFNKRVTEANNNVATLMNKAEALKNQQSINQADVFSSMLGNIPENISLQVKGAYEQLKQTGNTEEFKNQLNRLLYEDKESKVTVNNAINKGISLYQEEQKRAQEWKNLQNEGRALLNIYQDTLDGGVMQSMTNSLSISTKNRNGGSTDNNNQEEMVDSNKTTKRKETLNTNIGGRTLNVETTNEVNKQTIENTNRTNTNTSTDTSSDVVNSSNSSGSNIDTNEVEQAKKELLNTSKPNYEGYRFEAKNTDEAINNLSKQLNETTTNNIDHYSQIIKNNQDSFEVNKQAIEQSTFHSNEKVADAQRNYLLLENDFQNNPSSKVSREQVIKAKKELKRIQESYNKNATLPLGQFTDVTTENNAEKQAIDTINNGADKIKERANQEQEAINSSQEIITSYNQMTNDIISVYGKDGLTTEESEAKLDATEQAYLDKVADQNLTVEERSIYANKVETLKNLRTAFNNAKQNGKTNAKNIPEFIEEANNKIKESISVNTSAEIRSVLGNMSAPQSQQIEDVLSQYMNDADITGLDAEGNLVKMPYNDAIKSFQSSQIQDLINSGSWGIVDIADRLYDLDIDSSGLTNIVKQLHNEKDPSKQKILAGLFSKIVLPAMQKSKTEGDSTANSNGDDKGWSKSVEESKKALNAYKAIADRTDGKMFEQVTNILQKGKDTLNKVNGNNSLGIKDVINRDKTNSESSLYQQKLNGTRADSNFEVAAKSSDDQALANTIEQVRTSVKHLGQVTDEILPPMDLSDDTDLLIGKSTQEIADLYKEKEKNYIRKVGDELINVNEYETTMKALQQLSKIAKKTGYLADAGEYNEIYEKIKNQYERILNYNNLVRQKLNKQ